MATVLSSSRYQTPGSDPSEGFADQFGISSSGCLSFCVSSSAN
jgi:hypothetical protein